MNVHRIANVAAAVAAPPSPRQAASEPASGDGAALGHETGAAETAPKPTARRSWRVLWWLVPLVLLAATITANDLLLSARLGLLANPILSDGLSYLVLLELASTDMEGVILPETGPRVLSGEVVSPITSPLFTYLPVLRLFREHSPGWAILITVSYQLFGNGEWQAHTVKFWAVALLLSVMFFMVRRYSDTWFAWTAVLFTSVLPVVSTSVRSATYEFFISKRVDFGVEWFLGDLRPDFSFSAALLFTVFAFFEWRARPNRWTALLLGCAFGIAALLKVTVISALLLALAALTAYAWLVRRSRPLPTVRQFVAPALVGSAFLIPWIVAGGARRAVIYVVVNSTIMAGVWAGTGMSTGLDFAYYWQFFNYMMGTEAWVVIGLGLAVLAVRWWRGAPGSQDLVGFVFVVLVLWAYLSVTPAKSWPVGPALYLPLWAAAWCALGPVALRALRRIRLDARALAVGAGLYCALLTAGAWYAYASWPAYGRDIGPTNRRTTEELGEHLNRLLTPPQALLSTEIWGHPAAFRVGHPERWIWLYTSHHMYLEQQMGAEPEALAAEILGGVFDIKMAIVPDLSSISDLPHVTTTPIARPYFDAFIRQIKDRDSQYVVLRSYPIPADAFTSMNADEDGKLAPSLLLFMRAPEGTLPELGFEDPRDGILFGKGWQQPEARNGQRFRWATDDAELVLSPSGRSRLLLDVEPAPTRQDPPLQLSVVGEDGSVTPLPPLRYRGTVAVDVPGAANSKRGVRLRVEQPNGAPAYRVFRAAWDDGQGPFVSRFDAASLTSMNVADDIAPRAHREALSEQRPLPEDGLFVGPGWYPLEEHGGARFRWAAGNADVVVTRPTSREAYLTAEVEPGPGVGGRPIVVEVVDEAGVVAGSALVRGRQTVTLPLPVQPGAETQSFRLRVAGGGQAAPGDPRVLNFRVFSMSWGAASAVIPAPAATAGPPASPIVTKLQRFTGDPDIVPAGSSGELAASRLPADGLLIGEGWYPYETFGGASFRWVQNDAELVVSRPGGQATTLSLEIEPGPGLGLQPFDLAILDGAGRTVATAPVRGRETVTVPLPIQPGAETQSFRLHVEGGGRPTPNDPRVLNFRVFALRWAGR